MTPVNTEGGYIHLFRRLWDHPIFRDLNEASVFAWMLSMACWRPTRVRYKHLSITLERGQFAISTRDLAAKWGWSEAKARRYLDRLQTDAMIDAASDAGVSVITICNYNEFQPSSGSVDAPSGAPSDAAPTQHRRSTDAQNKEGKEKKEGKEEEVEVNRERDLLGDAPPAKTPDRIAEAFDLFNQAAQRAGIPTARALTSGRRATIGARLKEVGLTGWRNALTKLEASDFCRGGGDHGWKIDLDSLTQPKNFHRLLDGGFDNRTPKGNPDAPSPRRSGSRSFADRMQGIDAAVTASRFGDMAPRDVAPGDGDGEVIDGEFEHV